MNAWCEEFVVDGIKYSTNEDNISVSVTSSDNKYQGDIVIPSTVTYNEKSYSVTSIGHDAFMYSSGLTSVTIPSSVTSIDFFAFTFCPDIVSLIVDKENKVYDSRDNCNAIIESQSNTLVVGCMNTVIPNSVTSIGVGAFWSCTGLTSIAIPSRVTNIGDAAFNGCSSLTSVAIPSSVTSIGLGAFYGCDRLTSIEIPNSVTNIGEIAFYNCSSLTSVAIPSSVTSIGQGAFSGCIDLTSVEIPSSITSIGFEAFMGCISLTSVTIPSSVTSIDYFAFSFCIGLNTIVCNIEKPLPVSGFVFSNVDKSNCVLYVPAGCVDAYKAADVWSEFENICEIDPTAIDDVTVKDINTADAIYNLRGQKVDGSYKGIVIRNGKKVLVK